MADEIKKRGRKPKTIAATSHGVSSDDLGTSRIKATTLMPANSGKTGASFISGSLLDIDAHRRFAKVGMSVSLATLVVTAFGMKNKTIKRTHIIAGVCMVGFSLYHAGLYGDGVFKKLINSAKKGKK